MTRLCNENLDDPSTTLSLTHSFASFFFIFPVPYSFIKHRYDTDV